MKCKNCGIALATTTSNIFISVPYIPGVPVHERYECNGVSFGHVAQIESQSVAIFKLIEEKQRLAKVLTLMASWKE